jgi:catechol 2,3-dioxygenase-like lactoylglutathione lyase family enzyme
MEGDEMTTDDDVTPTTATRDRAAPVWGVHHVALVVDDLERALLFYTDALGLTEAHRPPFDSPGHWVQAGSAQIHLMLGSGPVPARYHFALGVSDLDAVVERLEQRGANPDRVPHTQGAGYQAFVRDPFGNTIELNQSDVS